MHIREPMPKDWVLPSHWSDKAGVPHQGVEPPRWSHTAELIRLGDVVIMHSRGRWGTALVTKIGRKNLTASYVTQGGIDSRPRFPNVTNKSVPIDDCYRADTARVWKDWRAEGDESLPQSVQNRLYRSHEPASGAPGPARLEAMFPLG